MITLGSQWKRSTTVTLMLALTIFHSALHGSFAFIALGPKTPQTSSLHLFDLLNEGKKALIRNMAGEYDAEAVRHWMFVFLNKFFRLSELTSHMDVGMHRSAVD
jgi:hypothetical protein